MWFFRLCGKVKDFPQESHLKFPGPPWCWFLRWKFNSLFLSFGNIDSHFPSFRLTLFGSRERRLCLVFSLDSELLTNFSTVPFPKDSCFRFDANSLSSDSSDSDISLQYLSINVCTMHVTNKLKQRYKYYHELISYVLIKLNIYIPWFVIMRR